MKRIAIILAAGTNSRIKDICFDRPKCLLSVCGQSLIRRIVNQFWDYVDEFYIAAGRNADKIKNEFPRLNNIHILDFEGKEFYGNGMTLKHAIESIQERIDSLLILESDIIISDATICKFIDVDSPSKFICVKKNINDHDDAIIQTSTGYRFTKERNANWRILGKFIGVTELPSSIVEKIANDKNIPLHYTEFISRYSTLDFKAIKATLNNAMEIDSREDYSFVLNNYNIKSVNDKFNPYQLRVNQGFQTYVGVYDVIGAKIAKQMGADGLFLGSYQISSAKGKKDTDDFTIWESLDVARDIRHANVKMPIILDGMSGVRNCEELCKLADKISELKIGGICIDNLKSPHQCSLNGNFQPQLLNVNEYNEKFKLYRQYLDTNCKFIARTEIMHVTNKYNIINKHLQEMDSLGVDILLPHYVKNDFGFLENVMKHNNFKTPLMIIPSQLLQVKKAIWNSLGFQYIIYANLDIRARTYQLERVYEDLNINTVFSNKICIANPSDLSDAYDFG